MDNDTYEDRRPGPASQLCGTTPAALEGSAATLVELAEAAASSAQRFISSKFRGDVARGIGYEREQREVRDQLRVSVGF